MKPLKTHDTHNFQFKTVLTATRPVTQLKQEKSKRCYYFCRTSPKCQRAPEEYHFLIFAVLVMWYRPCRRYRH